MYKSIIKANDINIHSDGTYVDQKLVYSESLLLQLNKCKQAATKLAFSPGKRNGDYISPAIRM